MAEFEVGYAKGNVISMAGKAVKTVFRTWWFAKRCGVPRDKWYGVYYKGTEIKIAEFGCLPSAEDNARLFVEALYASPNKCSGSTV
jgi:hypothetical protein